MDWLTHIEDFSARLATTAADNDPSARVPTCPDWSLADLTWHLLEVQDFWAFIVNNRPAGPEEYAQPQRPADADLPTGLRDATARLLAALSNAAPSEAAWTWTDDHTVGFTHRRQAHEAFVHLADAQLATGQPLPIASLDFGADGIDELITNNLAPIPSWGSFAASDQLVTLDATDAKKSWTLRFGTFSGTSPDTGTTYTDEPQVQPAEGSATTLVEASASTLYLWLWGRAPMDSVTISGESRLVDELRSVVSGETQ